jgi:hypothetical protein
VSPSAPLTLGWLLSTLRWYEELRAKQAAYTGTALANSAEAASHVDTFRDLMRVSGEIDQAPGQGRLQLLCEEMDPGGGLSAVNMVKLRARVCRMKPCDIQEADLLALDEAADVLEGTRVEASLKGSPVPDRESVARRRNPKTRRGRRPDQDIDPREDRRLCRDWQAAKREGQTRKAFTQGRDLTVQDLIDAQQREKYRRTRDA